MGAHPATRQQPDLKPEPAVLSAQGLNHMSHHAPFSLNIRTGATTFEPSFLKHHTTILKQWGGENILNLKHFERLSFEFEMVTLSSKRVALTILQGFLACRNPCFEFKTIVKTLQTHKTWKKAATFCKVGEISLLISIFYFAGSSYAAHVYPISATHCP